MLFARRAILKTGFFALAMVAGPTFAAGAPQDPGAAGTTTITLDTVEVISEQLDIARLQIQPSLGASTYYFGPEALRTVPQGENAPLNQVLLQVHVRENMPMCNSGSTGCNCPRVSRSSARRSKPASPAAFRCSPAPCRPNTAARKRDMDEKRLPKII
jgi:hypothetical protein